MAELLLKDEVYAAVGAAMEVYNQLGPGFLEPVYQEAMEIETQERKIPTQPQCEIAVRYKGKQLKKFYIADLICFNRLKVGLIINFGSFGKLEWRRFVYTEEGSSRRPPRYLREDETQYPICED